MIWIYPALKWMHIVAATLVVGALAALAQVRPRDARDPSTSADLFDAVRLIVERMLLVSLAILFVTGLLLAGGPFPGPDDVDRQGLWVVLGMALWAALVAVGAGYPSLLARRARHAPAHRALAYSRHYRATIIVALSLAVLTVAIMVLKPTLEA